MKVQKIIEVRLLKKRMTDPAIDVVQYDTGVQLVFSLVDFDIPSGTSATLYVQKRSGKFVYQEKNITVSGNEITIDLENQALTEHGETKYQITLKNVSDTVTTFAGVLRIEKSLADANAVESKTVIRAFDEVVADHVAEFQTKAEQIVAACIATIPDDYTTMEEKVNELANAVKGYLHGAVVSADDVSPVEHNPVVKVHGKNLIVYPHMNTTKTQNGLTFTDNGDGSVTVKGTATAVTYYDLCNFANRFFTEGARYFNAMGNTVTFEGYTIKDCSVQQRESGNTFCHLVITAGQTMDKTFYPQVEIGTVATDYEPYIDPSTVTVSRCGKNFWHSRDLTYPRTVSGVTINYDSDSQIYTFNGTSTAPGDIYTVPNGTDIMHINAGETWTLKVEVMGGTIDGVATSSGKISPLVNTSSYTNTIHANTDSLYVTKTYTEAADITKMYFYIYASGTVFNNFKCRIQFEPNSKPTEFEKFKELSEHIPSSDGTVSGLTSVSPNMTILTDTEGAIVECEYNRDTNKVIEKLTNAIIALGGTV